MTGRIDIVEEETPKYTTVEIDFANGKKMCLVDYRKFGRVWVVKDISRIVGHLGIEPLSKQFTAKKFNEIIEKRTGKLNSHLECLVFEAIVSWKIDFVCPHLFP